MFQIFEESRGTLRDVEGMLGWLDDFSSGERDHGVDTKMRRRFKDMGFFTESIDNALVQDSNNLQGSAEIHVSTIGTTSSSYTTLSPRPNAVSAPTPQFWSVTTLHYEDYQSEQGYL